MASPVGSLVIAEAAPWTPEGSAIRYFYETLDGPWVGRVLRTFPRSSSLISRRGSRILPHGVSCWSIPFPSLCATRPQSAQTALLFDLVWSSRDYFFSKLLEPRSSGQRMCESPWH